MLSSLAPARRRLVAALGAVALLAAAGIAIALVRHAGAADVRPVSQATPGPMILVPGYGGSTDALAQLAVVLRARGKTVEVFHLLGDGRGDLDAQAQALGAAATRLRAKAHAESIDVIGYSTGGVVVRLWVRSYGGDSVARRVITLGSPHHGTDLAGAAGSLLPGACPPACQQLEPDSSLLAGLNDGDETPRGPTFVSIWTTHDDVVVPPSSAQLDGALNLTVQSLCATDPVNHGGLPRDTTVQSMLLRELAAGPPVRLGRGDCRLSS